MKLNVIHIFAYGEAQIISDEVKFKSAVSNFTKLQAVIDNVKSLKPTEVETKDYHAINIFKDYVHYQTTEKQGVGNYKVEYSQLNESLITELIAEFKALKTQSEVTNP